MTVKVYDISRFLRSLLVCQLVDLSLALVYDPLAVESADVVVDLALLAKFEHESIILRYFIKL
jgi:hypothetical protein